MSFIALSLPAALCVLPKKRSNKKLSVQARNKLRSSVRHEAERENQNTGTNNFWYLNAAYSFVGNLKFQSEKLTIRL